MSEYEKGRVTIVILARNEEHTIAEAIASASGWCREVVVMDGCSTDGTASAARIAGARVVKDDGRGKGSAIRQSLGLIETEFVVFMDADGSHDALDTPKLVGPLADGTADLCVGSRFAGGSDELSVSIAQLVRTVGNILMNIAINNRWNVELTDTLNGFRAVRRDAALRVKLKENSHTIEQEMVMKILRHGMKVVNAPTHEYKRRFGESHIRIWREWPRFVWCVVENVIAPNVASPAAAGESPAQVAAGIAE
ncbi:MAG TPA: glycosyltransferase family 2 protein [Gemmatimonadaceae bacterium]|nr:glycosyltransferase family 2 protein [Gemmatimonadaceae bacterium]